MVIIVSGGSELPQNLTLTLGLSILMFGKLLFTLF